MRLPLTINASRCLNLPAHAQERSGRVFDGGVCFVSRSVADWRLRVFAGDADRVEFLRIIRRSVPKGVDAVFFDRGFFTTFRFAHYFRFILCLS